jgi:hypothetical protein
VSKNITRVVLTHPLHHFNCIAWFSVLTQPLHHSTVQFSLLTQPLYQFTVLTQPLHQIFEFEKPNIHYLREILSISCVLNENPNFPIFSTRHEIDSKFHEDSGYEVLFNAKWIFIELLANLETRSKKKHTIKI